MFIPSIALDLGLLLISFISLVLWLRFRDGNRLPGLFRMVFIIGFSLFVFSLFKKYGSMAGDLEWVFASMNVFLLGIVAVLANILTRLKIPFILTSIVGLGLLYYGKTKMDQYLLSTYIVHDISQDWEFLVKADNDKLLSLSIANDHRITVERAFVSQTSDRHELDNYFAIDVAAGCESSLLKIKAQLDADPSLRVVEWNEKMKIDPVVSEIYRRNNDKIWANDPDVDNQWHYDLLQIDDLHRYLNIKKIKPKKRAKLFILDSGVEANHEDIRTNYFSVKKDYDNDSNGHGTHCAGIAGAVSNNNVGIASLSPDSKYYTISGIRVMSPFGVGTQRTIIKGIVEAVDQKADVISMSLGGVSSDKKQKAYKEAFDYAKKNNVVLVVAAGNSNDDASRYTPANVNGAIAVTAVNRSGQKASFSNYANRLSQPVAAPGVEIYSTMPNSKYASLSGTSMATPFVSGLAALMKSIDPSLTSDQIFKLISESGKATNDPKATGAMIQPYEAIKALLEQDR